MESRKSSPRMWGCFSSAPARVQGYLVFPTHVGVFPLEEMFNPLSESLPHACGGVSFKAQYDARLEMSSPRMWGCF